ncbi:MAG: hypothetical protein ACF788_05670 [Novipirellula sp. JB048]
MNRLESRTSKIELLAIYVLPMMGTIIAVAAFYWLFHLDAPTRL